jgi:putative transposase
MADQRKRRSAKFKFEVALEALMETKTVNEIASAKGLHPSQVSQWKRQLLAEGAEVFRSGPDRGQRAQEIREAELYEQIGRLKMALDWLTTGRAAPKKS